MSKTVAIIQARLGSSRLPGKVLMEIQDRPMIDHVVQRVAMASHVDEVVVATTDSRLDQPLVEHCLQQNWSVFRGSELDVLDRYWNCASEYQADSVVRVTSDCPLIDPELIDQVVEKQLLDADVDYVCNFYPERMFPRGLDVECFSIKTLERVFKAAKKPEFREHVTLMVYRHPELFRLAGVEGTQDHSDWRWTVDTAEDLQLIQLIYEHFQGRYFGWREAAEAYRAHANWWSVNQHVQQKAA